MSEPGDLTEISRRALRAHALRHYPEPRRQQRRSSISIVNPLAQVADLVFCGPPGARTQNRQIKSLQL